MMRFIVLIFIALFHRHIDPMQAVALFASWVSVTYSFSPSTTIKSSEVNQNFTDLVNAIEKAMPSNANGHGIIIWSGAVANVPSGWYLCDGSNGTPDLRNKFVLGAGGSYSVGATGGAANHTLTEAEIPVMTHAGHNADKWYGTHHCRDNGTGTPPGVDVLIGLNDATIPNHGGGASFSILNPYHALCYIMKS